MVLISTHKFSFCFQWHWGGRGGSEGLRGVWLPVGLNHNRLWFFYKRIHANIASIYSQPDVRISLCMISHSLSYIKLWWQTEGFTQRAKRRNELSETHQTSQVDFQIELAVQTNVFSPCHLHFAFTRVAKPWHSGCSKKSPLLIEMLPAFYHGVLLPLKPHL